MDTPNYDDSWAGPEPAEKKKFLWLGQSWSQQTSQSGWRIFDHAGQLLRHTTDRQQITLFEDGTWSYGFWK